MMRSRSVERAAPLLVAVLIVGAGLYFALWHRGGVRTLWGTRSGSGVPAEAGRLSEQERRSQTETRAREILAAVLAFESKHGRLPKTLLELTPDLPAIPAPLTSTSPFRYFAGNAGEFVIEWEAFPNADYEKYWLDRGGSLHADL